MIVASRQVAFHVVLAFLVGLTFAISNYPALNVTITPRSSNDVGAISALDISMAIQAPSVQRTDVLLTMPLSIFNAPSQNYDKGAITARDSAGPLSLSFNDTRNGQTRSWYPCRVTHGNVLLNFRAVPRAVNASTPTGARVDLRKDQGGLAGAGLTFLPVPPSGKGPPTIYAIQLSWDLSDAPNASTVWTFGDDVESHILAPTEWLQTSYYAVGLLHRYSFSREDNAEVLSWAENQRPLKLNQKLRETESFGVYWFGIPPFDVSLFSRNIANLFRRMSAFFHDAETTYRVFLRRSLRGFGGTAMRNSFMLEYDFERPYLDIELFEMIAHEMIHNWALMDGEEIEDETNTWYIEGIATYYAAFLPYRFNLTDLPTFLHAIDTEASAYYTNPLRNISLKETHGRAFTSKHAVRLPYHRGFMHFVQLAAQLQNISSKSVHSASPQATTAPQSDRTTVQSGNHNGKVSGSENHAATSLDALVLALWERRRSAQSFALHDWLALLGAALGSRMQADIAFNAVASGVLIVPPANSLSCFGLKLVRQDQHVFELGFDEEGLRPGGIVRGLVPGSRAQEAELREGDEVVRAGALWDVADEYGRVLEVVVERGDDVMEVVYWPRWWKVVECWQWKVKG